jgi:hypothetical protein
MEAYDRHQDASDAWDPAIQAVKAVLIDVVVPKKTNPNLDHVLGHLQRQGNLFRGCNSKTEGRLQRDLLIKMLELIWPHPNRAGSGALQWQLTAPTYVGDPRRDQGRISTSQVAESPTVPTSTRSLSRTDRRRRGSDSTSRRGSMTTRAARCQSVAKRGSSSRFRHVGCVRGRKRGT